MVSGCASVQARPHSDRRRRPYFRSLDTATSNWGSWTTRVSPDARTGSRATNRVLRTMSLPAPDAGKHRKKSCTAPTAIRSGLVSEMFGDDHDIHFPGHDG